MEVVRGEGEIAVLDAAERCVVLAARAERLELVPGGALVLGLEVLFVDVSFFDGP